MKDFLKLLWKSSTKFEIFMFIICALITLITLLALDISDFIICLCFLICIIMFAAIRLILTVLINENVSLRDEIHNLIMINDELHNRILQYENNEKLKHEIEESNN